MKPMLDYHIERKIAFSSPCINSCTLSGFNTVVLCGRKAKNKKAQERRVSKEETVMIMKYWRQFS